KKKKKKKKTESLPNKTAKKKAGSPQNGNKLNSPPLTSPSPLAPSPLAPQKPSLTQAHTCLLAPHRAHSPQPAGERARRIARSSLGVSFCVLFCLKGVEFFRPRCSFIRQATCAGTSSHYHTSCVRRSTSTLIDQDSLLRELQAKRPVGASSLPPRVRYR
ncbi:unnamed protein product, partial [Ixodes pacificus]